MGYGFCIQENPADEVVVRLGRPPPQIHSILKTSLPQRFKSAEWDPTEAGFFIRGSKHHTGGYPDSFGLSCLRGIPSDLVISIQIMVSTAFESSYEHPEHKRAELWWATLDQLNERFQQKLMSITQWDDQIPASPQNKCQQAAKIYRDGQIAILTEVMEELDSVLGPLDREEISFVDAFGSI